MEKLNGDFNRPSFFQLDNIKPKQNALNFPDFERILTSSVSKKLRYVAYSQQ